MPHLTESNRHTPRRTPILAVDAVIYLPDGRLVLVERKNPPFQGWWALPGGIVEVGETVEQAIIREVKEETGLEVRLQHLVGVFSDPERDPRGHTVSVVFLATPISGNLSAGSDASRVKAFHEPPRQLAFDHKKIIFATKAFRGVEDRKNR